MQGIKHVLAAVSITAMTMTAVAAVKFTWTGKAGDNRYNNKNNWSISGGTSTRNGPSWTEDCLIDTDTIGGDVTIILDTAECNCNIFQTKGKYKVTIETDGNDYTLSPYYLYLNAMNNEFNVPVSLRSVSSSRVLPIDHNATFKKDMKLSDNITIDNSTTAGAMEMTAVHFYGKVTVASGKVLGLCRAPFTNYGAVHFHGPLICDELRFGLGWKSGYAYFYSSENQIGKVGWCYSQFICCNENVWPSALAVSWPSDLPNPATGASYFYWDIGRSYNALNMNGYSQQAKSINYQHATRRPYITSGTPATLSLIGSDTAVANVIVDGAVSIAVNSGDLVQEFTESVSTTTGTLAANQGTLKLSGATSFANVPEITVGAGATFEVNATTIGALGGVTNINVASGGTLKVGANVSNPFGTKLAIHLAEGAYIDTAADFTVSEGLFVGDAPIASGSYSTASWLKSGSTGSVTINAPNVEATYIWTGAAGDGKFTTANNWQGGIAPIFTSTLATYIIPVAAEGTPLQITVDTPVSCKSMNFTCPDVGIVELVAQGSGKLTVVNGNINATNDTAKAVVARLFVPVEFSDALTVRAGSDDNKSTSYGVEFRTSLNSIGPADITKYGYGTLLINGENNNIVGNIHNWQGNFEVRGANPIGGGTTYTLNNYSNQGDTKTTITLNNATVNRNINTRAPADQCGFTLRAIGNCTINGAIHNNAGGATSTGHLRFYLSETPAGQDPTYCTVKGLIQADNNGFFILSGKAGTLRCEGGLNCVRPYCDTDNANVFLEVAGNKTVSGLAGSDYAWFMKIPLRLAIDNLVYRSAQGDQYYTCCSGSAGIDLNGHKLSLANFNCTADAFAKGGGYIKGGAGSVLTLCGAAVDANGMRVLEQASLVRAGTGTSTIADACTSTGSLTITGGTVNFTSAGSWQSVSGVTVGGGASTATLALANNKAFDKTTVVELGANGIIDVASGVTARVGELWINGVKQHGGSWSTTRDSTHFTGAGTLYVGAPGLTVLIR